MERVRSLTALITVALALAFVPATLASDFSKTISVSGGSPRRLSDVLANGGYQGNTDQVYWMTICVDSSNTNTLYLGASNVSDSGSNKGFPIKPGECNTLPYSSVPIATSRIYLYVATTEDESFQAHGQG